MPTIALFALILGGLICGAQQPSAQHVSNPLVSSESKPDIKNQAPAQGNGGITSGYILGPGDQIAIHVLSLDEINDKPISIDPNGSIRLPLIGEIHVSGLTVQQLQSQITQRLNTYMVQPDVSVSITNFRSQPVSVIGAVNTPGVHQLEGRKTLAEMLSLAGGLRPDAGYRVELTRHIEWGNIPLPNAVTDPTGTFSVAEIALKEIIEAKNPAKNVLIMPNDVISVPRAQVVYVIGEVHKPGGFALQDRETVSVLEALSMAEGLGRTAAPAGAKILRARSGDSNRIQIAVDLKKILGGREKDVPLQPNDILLIPNSKSKNAAVRSFEAALQIGTGLAIYRP
jgi:polysaccharide export outer membrane protein